MHADNTPDPQTYLHRSVNYHPLKDVKIHSELGELADGNKKELP